MGERGAEEAVRPLLGQRPGVAEHDRHLGEADLRFGEALRHHGRPDAVELEHRRVAVLHHQGGVGHVGQRGEEVAELAAGEGAHEVGKALALDGGHERAVDLDAVVAGGERPADGGGLLVVEAPWVALVAVDDDLEDEAARPAGGHAHVGPGLAGGPSRLPEDHVSAARLGEHELRAALPSPIEDEVDGGAAPHAGTHGHALHDLGVVGPAFGRVAVHLGGARPGVPDLEDDAGRAERKAEQVGQARILLRIAGDHEVIDHAHPPCTRRRLPAPSPQLGRSPVCGVGSAGRAGEGSRGSPGVRAWLEAQADAQLWLSVLVVGELRRGVDLIGRRGAASAAAIGRWLDGIIEDFSDRILPITATIAQRWATMSVPDPVPVVDGLIAATAAVHDLTVVTRNVANIDRTGIGWIDPFTSATSA
ncbi:MAG: type II toxin-antitoxin system VapC family toxin [Acidimicrobiales bacterium]